MKTSLDFALGVGIIVVIFLLGDFLHRIGVPVPGGVLGLLLFYAALQLRIIRLEWVDRAAGFLLRHMVLLFIPLTVGLMDMGGVLSRQFGAICLSLVVSFVAVLLVTGLLGQRLLGPPEDAPGAEGQL
ncbi:CidA/LrgA family protein [Occallatibacter savannae]|uniref:CidA/LrgA family protein n=1 Tax=Occallatibacter savannae TaxID=1002691 RepID=UPI000D698D94|nr:CidA/LrgA family protein [Occallatibacter savannae]